MAKDVQAELEAALEEAAASETETEESSTEEDVEETEEKATKKAEKPAKAKGHKGANDRIQDLLAKVEEAEGMASTHEETVAARDKEIGTLIEQLELQKGEHAVVQQINHLHQTNPEMKAVIEALDQELQGKNPDWTKLALPNASTNAEGDGKEGDEKSDVDAVAQARELIQTHQNEVDEQLQEQADELILHKADILTDAYIAELPDEYNEEDQHIIRSVLSEHIDWDAIEENPNDLPDKFAEGFQSVLKWYRTPKGAGPSVDEDGDENTTKEAKPVTEESVKDFANLDWGKLKTVETPSGKQVVPAVDDTDYASALGDMLKKANQLEDAS